MKKEDISKPRFAIQHDNHQQSVASVLCSMMEHQSLVDLAIRCGNNTIHVHKTIIAANSPYFKDHLEKNVGTEQIIINGLDFAIVKAIVEFMYCGETHILEEQFKHFVAAASMFKLRGLQALESEVYPCEEVLDLTTDKSIHIPPPTFLTKKPKYSSTYLHFNNPNVNNMEKNVQNDANFSRKIKRKYIRSEAERACAKEAAASRMALEALKKELANSQVSSFVIEESCTETTVENFIPHNEETFLDNLNQITTVPVQVVNYNLNPPISTHQIITPTKIVPYMLPRSLQKPEDETPTDKIKNIIGDNLSNNVEIMFKTSDGSYINVTDDMLQNISRGELQYQVIDENGQASEVQELRVEDKTSTTDNNDVGNKFLDNVHSFVNTENTLLDNNEQTENNQAADTELYNQTSEMLQNNNSNDDTSIVINDLSKDVPGKLESIKSYDFKKSDYQHSEFIITEHSGSCPIYVPTSLNSRDPLSEACYIAENLSNIDDRREHFFAQTFDVDNENDMNNAENKMQEAHGAKYLIKEKPEQSLIEFSPRKLRSARQLNIDMQSDNDENEKKRLITHKKRK